MTLADGRDPQFVLLSAEVRWFWRAVPPANLEDWFLKSGSHGCGAGGPSERTDKYMCEPNQVALGLKNRGKNPGVEVKGLIEIQPDVAGFGGLVSPVEIWGKWTSERLRLDENRTIGLAKSRWIRKFDTANLAEPYEVPLGPDEQPLAGDKPDLGCNVELTRVHMQANDEVWWTFGFEAFGPLPTVVESLRAVLVTLIARRPPALAEGMVASYPKWLSSCLTDHSMPLTTSTTGSSGA